MKTDLLSLAKKVDELYIRIYKDNAVTDTDKKSITVLPVTIRLKRQGLLATSQQTWT